MLSSFWKSDFIRIIEFFKIVERFLIQITAEKWKWILFTKNIRLFFLVKTNGRIIDTKAGKFCKVRLKMCIDNIYSPAIYF